MKRNIFLICIIILMMLFVLSLQFNYTKNTSWQDANILNNTVCQDLYKNDECREGFFAFLFLIAHDIDHQLERIKFPLKQIKLTENYLDYDTLYMNSEDWDPKYFYFDMPGLIPLIYVSFEDYEKDSGRRVVYGGDERVLWWADPDGGIALIYFFKCIDGKWFLVKWYNFST